MATENVVSKKYRILSDVANKVWDVISFFTLAKDVETTNGKNLETTCGSITGITSSLTSTSTTMAASASAIKQLNDKIADLNSNLSDDIIIGTATGNDEITIGDKWNMLAVWTTINNKAAFEVCIKDEDDNLTHISGQYNIYSDYTSQIHITFNADNSGFTLKNWTSNTWNYAYK